MNKLLLNIQMFAEFKANLTDLIKKHTADDVFNGEDALKDLNDQILKYNSKNQPKVETFKDKAREEVIKELGIENVTNENQLKAYLANLTSTEQAQDLTDALASATDWETKYKDVNTKYGVANSKLINYDGERRLISDGVTATDADYHLFKINNSVTDEKDFDTAYQEYATANPTIYNTTPQPKTPITTNKPHVVVSQGKEVSSVEQILIDKGRLQQP